MPELRQDAASAALAAATLAQGRRLDLLSLALLLLALVLLLTSASGPIAVLLGISAAAALVQRYFALRCDLDARIFAHWASSWSGLPAADPLADLCAFDRALADIFGLSATAAPPRPLAERIGAALRLIRHQVVALGFQLAAMLGALLWHLSQTGIP